MLQRIRVQTSDGVREYPFAPDAAALKAAADVGEVKPGDDIVYKQWLVWLLEDVSYMLILERLNIPPAFFGAGMAGPEFAPPVGGWSASPDGTQWSFTVNGQPVTPEQAEQFMRGGPTGN